MGKNFDKIIRDVLSEMLIFEFNTKWLQGILGYLPENSKA